MGPVWKGGYNNEEDELYQAVHSAIAAAGKHKCKSVSTSQLIVSAVNICFVDVQVL